MTTMNGSVVGLVDGLKQGIGVSGLTVPNSIIINMGAPNNIITTGVGSSIALDVVNGEFYMTKSAGGSTWVHLISGT